LASGALPLPLSSYVTTPAFRAITDSVVSYRMAGSFVLFLAERFGMPAVEAFMRGATRDDSVSAVRTRMSAAFGVTLEQAEDQWLALLRQPPG